MDGGFPGDEARAASAFGRERAEYDYQHTRCRHGFWKPRGGHASPNEATKQEDEVEFDDVANIDTSDKMGLQIMLKSCKGLNLDIAGSAPTVKLEIPGSSGGGGSWTSKGSEKSDSPQFNETLFLVCSDFTKAKLVIEVSQKSNLVVTKTIGAAVIDIKSLSLSLTKTDMVLKTIALKEQGNERKKKGALQGEVVLAVKQAYQRDALGMRQAARSRGKKLDKIGKLVTVVVVYATNLVATDKNGLSDPYCKIEVDGNKRQTATKFKTLAPSFREQFDLLVNNIDDGLSVKLYDKDFASSEFMGGKNIDLTRYPLDEPVSREHALKNKDGTPCGNIFLQITVTDLLKEPAKLTNKQLAEYPGVLRLCIRKAKGINAADRNGFSDPFCVIETGHSRYRTRTIYKSINPEWDRNFVIPVTDIFSSVSITLYDEDGGGKTAEFLGCISLRLLQLKADDEAGSDKWYALKTLDGLKRAGGDIQLDAAFSYQFPKCYGTLLTHLEKSYIDKTEKFKRPILLRNIARITHCVNSLISGIVFVNNVLGGKKGNTVTLVGQVCWTMACLYGELYHVPLTMALLLLGRRVFQKLTGGIARAGKVDVADLDANESDYDSEEDEDEDDVPEKTKKKEGGGFLKKLERGRQLAEDLANKIDGVASLMEKMKNVVFWHRLQISALVTLVLLLATIIVFIGGQYLRFAFLIGGYSRVILPIIKRYKGQKLRPAHKQSPPPLNLLMRVPDDLQLLQYRRFKPRQLDKKRREREKLKLQMKATQSH